MITEFIGLPGAGKSYLCGQLDGRVQTEARRGITIRHSADKQSRFPSIVSKLYRAGRFIRRHPAVANRVVKWTWSSGQESISDFGAKTVNLFSELDSSDRPRAAIVNDQGVLQAVWSLLLRARKPADQRKVLELIRPWLPSTVIYVSVEREENICRLTKRESGRSRFDGLAPEKLETELDRGAKMLDELLAEWKAVVADGRTSTITNAHNCDIVSVMAPVTDLVHEDLCNCA